MVPHPRPLIEVFAALPDFRRPRGKRHPLAAIFALACSAMLCGYRNDSAMADWGRNDGAELAHALGFTHQPPCAATLHTVLRRVDRDVVEAQLGAWAEGLLVGTPRAAEEEEPLAIDGKTLRGSRKQGAPGAHLSRSSLLASASPSPNRRWQTRPMRSRWCWTCCARGSWRAVS